MNDFYSMGLPDSLSNTLQKMQFTQPTPIQAKAIPLALQGKDILGSAQTGTGKTGAFGIPLVAHLLSNPKACALVTTPTRELAKQVSTQLELILGDSFIKSALLIGGESMHRQLRQLKSSPQLIVGTPGRINDHLERKTLSLSSADFLVLDETDRMLDMGFSDQIESIVKRMPKTRQTLLFSATLPHNIMKVANRYLENPERVSVDAESSPAKNIKHEALFVNEGEKHDSLLLQLEEREGSIIIFVKTKSSTERMAKRLVQAGHTARAIHGDLRQSRRDQVINNFRNEKYRILVATDVAARGLDIPHIKHVINYNLPQCAEDHIHRIGRTARAGEKGEALSLVTPADKRKWHDIECLLDPEKKKKRPFEANKKRGRSQNKNADQVNKKRSFFKKEGGAESGKPSKKRSFSRKDSSSESNAPSRKRSFARKDSDAESGSPSGKRSFARKDSRAESGKPDRKNSRSSSSDPRKSKPRRSDQSTAKAGAGAGPNKGKRPAPSRFKPRGPKTTKS